MPPENSTNIAPDTGERRFHRVRSLVIASSILLLVALGVYTFFLFKSPRIHEIDSAIAFPGSVIRLIGNNFGDRRGDSRVIMDGIELTRSSYHAWSSTSISVMVPLTLDSGLVMVMTRYGKSNPVMFLNRDHMPILPAKADTL